MYIEDITSLIFLFFSFQSVIIGITFLINKKGIKKANIVLSLFLFVYAAHLLLNFIYWQDLFSTPRYVHLSSLSNILWLLYGPLLYTYFSIIFKNRIAKLYRVIIFMPIVVYLIVYHQYILLSTKDKLLHSSLPDINNFLNLISHNQFIIFRQVVNLAFIILILIIYFKNNKKFENRKEIKKWSILIIISFFVFISKNLIHSLIGENALKDVNIILSCFTFILPIIIITYFSYFQPKVFNGLTTIEELVLPLKKYKKSRLTKSHSDELKKKLISLMVEKQIYKQNDLNLGKLSELIGIDKHSTSELINSSFNKSISEFINDYRIEESKLLLKEQTFNSQMNIIEVAYAVGFNTRMSFNNAFKKRIGTTPTNYLKSLSNSAS